MVTLKWSDGLGNRMFQHASTGGLPDAAGAGDGAIPGKR